MQLKEQIVAIDLSPKQECLSLKITREFQLNEVFKKKTLYLKNSDYKLVFLAFI